MTYFEILPGDIRIELLKYLPIALLIPNSKIKKVQLMDKDRYIFSIDCFKIHANEDLWKSLYQYYYSKDPLPSASYRDTFITHKSKEVSAKCDNLLYAVEYGLDQIISKVLNAVNDDFFDYNYFKLFEVAVKNRHMILIKKLNSLFKFNKNLYQSILNNLHRHVNLNDLEKIDEITDLLLARGASFPTVSHNSDGFYLGEYHLPSDIFVTPEKSQKFIQFLLKHNAITDCQSFFEKAVKSDVPLDIVKWCMKNMKISITENVFNSLSHEITCIDFVIDAGYVLTFDNIVHCKYNSNFEAILKLYISQEINKSKIN